MEMPTEGEPAPDFRLPADDGKTYALRDLRGKKVVLYFYPMTTLPGARKRPVRSGTTCHGSGRKGRSYWA